MTDENAENRKILLSIAGAQIPGGCNDCQGTTVVHAGALNEAGDDVEVTDDIEKVVFRLAIYHETSCPFYGGVTR